MRRRDQLEPEGLVELASVERLRASLRLGILLDMLWHMRTTVEISDSLFAQVKRTMQRRRTTLRALVEEGLARVVAERPVAPARRPRHAAFPGEPGLVEPLLPDDLPQVLRALRHAGREGER